MARGRKERSTNWIIIAITTPVPCTGGTFTYDAGGGDIRTATKNACDFCHLIIHTDDTLIEAKDLDHNVTLNYVLKRIHDPSLPDLDDDALILELQAAI